MNNNHTIHLVEIPIGGKQGAAWNRLHEEREEICETLGRTSESGSAYSDELHARLRNIDDALDRLMSGSYGIFAASCEKPATADLALGSLHPFDTILLRTENSEYRILLLDPQTGRALVEGGAYLPEPREGFVKGSALPGAAYNEGAITVGSRLEMWVNENIFLTSPVKSIDVKHSAAAESPESISAALHESIAR